MFVKAATFTGHVLHEFIHQREWALQVCDSNDSKARWHMYNTRVWCDQNLFIFVFFRRYLTLMTTISSMLMSKMKVMAAQWWGSCLTVDSSLHFYNLKVTLQHTEYHNQEECLVEYWNYDKNYPFLAGWFDATANACDFWFGWLVTLFWYMFVHVKYHSFCLVVHMKGN